MDHQIVDYSVVAAIALFIADKLWQMMDRKNRNHEKALEQNTLALVRLETTIKFLEERIIRLEKK